MSSEIGTCSSSIRIHRNPLDHFGPEIYTIVEAGYNPGWVAYLGTIFVELLHRHVHFLLLSIVKLGLLPDNPFINLAEAPLAN